MAVTAGVTEELGSEINVIFTIDAPHVEHASIAEAAEASEDEDEATAALVGGKSLWTARVSKESRVKHGGAARAGRRHPLPAVLRPGQRPVHRPPQGHGGAGGLSRPDGGPAAAAAWAPSGAQAAALRGPWETVGMQRNPEELYELGPAASDIAGAPMLHYLEGFIDAGTAGRLLAEHLLRAFPHETVARFDTDRLIDYRSRRPLMTYDNSRWESYEPPELALHLLHDQGGRPFLLLTGPEPDHEWDLFSRAVLSIAAQLDTGPAISFLGIPAGMPHTRPLGVIAHATREELLAGHQRLPSRIQVPGSAPALIELRLGEAGRDALGFAVQVPHYLAQAVYPPAALALLGSVTTVDRARPARRRAPRGRRPHQRGDPAAGRGVGGGRGAGPRARAAVRHGDREPAGRGRGHRTAGRRRGHAHRGRARRPVRALPGREPGPDRSPCPPAPASPAGTTGDHELARRVVQPLGAVLGADHDVLDPRPVRARGRCRAPPRTPCPARAARRCPPRCRGPRAPRARCRARSGG